MAYMLVCDQQYSIDLQTGVTVCEGTETQMPIDPLVAIDPQTGAEYLASGFGLGLLVFSMAWSARRIVDLVRTG